MDMSADSTYVKEASIAAESCVDTTSCMNHTNVGQRTDSYPGDFVDVTATPIKDKLQKLEFADPAELVNFFDTSLAKGQNTLHKWQTEILESFATVKPTSQHPHKFCLVAANGSGKDMMIAAPFAVWFALCKIQSRVIITSSSGTQLTSQTEPAIRALCEKVNLFFGQEYFRIRQRYIKCRLSGSEIRMFATDESGKAEGYHPMVPGAEMVIMINEAKSIAKEIHEAIKRCSGFNYWFEYSTPGERLGFFYKDYCEWNQVDLNKLPEIKTPGKYGVRVTSYDCPHLSAEEIEDDKRDLGEHSALFRSKHLALFTSLGGEVIISTELLDKLSLSPPQFNLASWPKRVGIDLAAGGDENSICYTQGNRVLKETYFRETDTTITADRIEQDLKDNGIEKDHDYIFADDGGVGHAIIDMLVRRGWKIKRIMNQWASLSNKKQFGNRGAENWYRVKRIFEELQFDVTKLSAKTKEQLTSRRYKQMLTGARIFLESKKEAKANGRPSPDRADAFILSLTGLSLDDFIKAKPVESKAATPKEGESILTPAEVPNYYDDNVTYAMFNRSKSLVIKSMGVNIRNSLRAALGGKSKTEKVEAYNSDN